MWYKVGKIVYNYRVLLVLTLLASTIFMAWHAKDVKLSYEFTRAMPTNNEKYTTYQNFRKKFGEDGALLVAGIQTTKLYTPKVLQAYVTMQQQLKGINGVQDVKSITSAVNLTVNEETGKLQPTIIFSDSIFTQPVIDKARTTFEGLPIYKYILYNPTTNAYLCGIKINADSLKTKNRENIVSKVDAALATFEKETNITVHKSGLPYIRTSLAVKVLKEMKLFLVLSVLFSAIILFAFFRSISATLLSLTVVAIGVIFSLGTIELLGYTISILNALIPPLVIVIGIPNCIYFLNKYHVAWQHTQSKKEAIITMISKMGVVTLFCNISAAIGFAVFGLTRSVILQEFGVVAGINILLLFFISLILIPFALSIMPPPKPRQLKYLHNPLATKLLTRIEGWAINHPKYTIGGTLLVVLISSIGLFKLQSVGYIVDDLPKNDAIYTDLKFFEKNFKGIMPLEITIRVPDDKVRLGDKAWRQFAYKLLDKVSELEDSIFANPNFGKPTSIVDGIKFAYRAKTANDTLTYLDAEAWSLIKQGVLQQGLSTTADTTTGEVSLTPTTALSDNNKKLLQNFMDSAKHEIRISATMADVGTLRLNETLQKIEAHINTILDSSKNVYIASASYAKPDSSKFAVSITGSTVTFLEGSNYIIKGLKESILWAFVLIAACMVFLFRSGKILLCSLIPNVIPLLITAGIMGWVGVPLKPSTVLVFSMVLGISIDITIRFLVNYKQELPLHNGNVTATVCATIRQTGLSILYTSAILMAGFVIFMFSHFGGTFALGWLTTLTLLVATITNLLLLPVLLLYGSKQYKK